MLLRTHLAFAALIIILFIQHVSNAFVFSLLVLIATFLPDIDSGFSITGRNIFSRMLMFFTKHRGIFHSLTLCAAISAVIALFFPKASLGFFLGYGFHLFLDAFTKEGIMPFWPWRAVSKGPVRTGRKTETSFFVLIILLDLLLLVMFFKRF